MEEGKEIIELRFKALEQLFDQTDPSVLSQRELTTETEECIISNMDVVHMRKPVRLDLIFPPGSSTPPAPEIIAAVRHHFGYLLEEHKREAVIFIRHRRVSVVFAGVNVIFGIIYASILYLNPELAYNLAWLLLGGLIIILNWTTIWDTYEFFVYDGRLMHRRKKVMQKVLGSEIRVVMDDEPGSGS
ncbi:hypothetical protein [Methanolinea mesophila]|uniref:hypothetical protein n=1 Tax=Methanolinea mesophila TaxID=547055 RepID=UPI001AEA5C21|nr:hypothetical protein [Methanolinea mesophila]